jgi:hypothetical protein
VTMETSELIGFMFGSDKDRNRSGVTQHAPSSHCVHK